MEKVISFFNCKILDFNGPKSNLKPFLGNFYIEATKLKFSWLIVRKLIIEILTNNLY
jgi:hypothetical protein